VPRLLAGYDRHHDGRLGCDRQLTADGRRGCTVDRHHGRGDRRHDRRGRLLPLDIVGD